MVPGPEYPSDEPAGIYEGDGWWNDGIGALGIRAQRSHRPQVVIPGGDNPMQTVEGEARKKQKAGVSPPVFVSLEVEEGYHRRRG